MRFFFKNQRRVECKQSRTFRLATQRLNRYSSNWRRDGPYGSSVVRSVAFRTAKDIVNDRSAIAASFCGAKAHNLVRGANGDDGALKTSLAHGHNRLPLSDLPASFGVPP